MITTIIFDYGGVLGSDATEWSTRFKDIARILKLTPAQLDALWKSMWPALGTGHVSLNEFWRAALKKSGKKEKRGTLMNIYRRNIFLNVHMLDMVLTLKKKGFILALLANESREGMKMKKEKFSLDKVFDTIYCSADLGVVKPDPHIFKYVMNDLKTPPEKILFIDDRKENIRAAKKLGIRTILFRNDAHARKALHKLHLLP